MPRLVQGRPATQGCGYHPCFEVVTVDARPVSRAGSGRLAELADRLGLSRALDQQLAGSGVQARRPKPVTRNGQDLWTSCFDSSVWLELHRVVGWPEIESCSGAHWRSYAASPAARGYRGTPPAAWPRTRARRRDLLHRWHLTAMVAQTLVSPPRRHWPVRAPRGPTPRHRIRYSIRRWPAPDAATGRRARRVRPTAQRRPRQPR